MTKEELLKEIILEKYGSVRQFALKLKIYPNSLSKQLKEYDLKNYKAEMLDRICEDLEIDSHAILNGELKQKISFEFEVSDEEIDFLNKFHLLSSEDRDDIKFLIDRKLERQKQAEEENKAL